MSRANKTRLACDGPLNGDYIAFDEAKANGYVLSAWPFTHPEREPELVWMIEENVEEPVAINYEDGYKVWGSTYG